MAEDDRRVFAKHLASLVRKSKITIAELAKASHTSKETAIAYLSGEAFPKVCRWRAIAVLLGLRSVNDLFPRIDVDPVLFRERKRVLKRRPLPYEIAKADAGLIASHLRLKLDKSGRLPASIAEACGVSVGTANGWFNGKGFPEPGQWRPLAQCLGLLSIDQLLPPLRIGKNEIEAAKTTIRHGGVASRLAGTIQEAFANNFRALVAKSGLTVAELAARTGRAPAVVNQYLQGNSLPRVADFPAIASALGLEYINELLPNMPVEKFGNARGMVFQPEPEAAKYAEWLCEMMRVTKTEWSDHPGNIRHGLQTIRDWEQGKRLPVLRLRRRLAVHFARKLGQLPEEFTTETFGQRVTALANVHGMTLLDVAAEAKISEVTMVAYLQGKLPVHKLDAARLDTVLGTRHELIPPKGDE